MSRRISQEAKRHKKKPRVRFPAELVFLDSIKENDLRTCHAMLQKASLAIDLNGLNDSGLTPLHQAVLEGNLQAVKLLVVHGADVNKPDSDTWTPLHAACAEGHADIVRYLLYKGASKEQKTAEGERALDLIDASDLQTIGAMLETQEARRARLEGSSHHASSEASSSRQKRQRKGSISKKKKPVDDDDEDDDEDSDSD